MHTHTATELHEDFVQGKRTATDIVKHYLGRIESHNANLGAFLTITSERALNQAAKLDAKRAKGEPLGKLAGIPIAVKDNINVKDVITTCGSKFLTNFKAPYDATVTQLLEQEDAIIIGKTNLDEFAMGSSTENSALQKTKNPWNLNCTPGGSSGGSAVAVAARLCPIALGSDTGGSIRQPASLCGIFGFKPTYGRVSRYGLVAFGSSLDQIGPFGTSVEDIALIMEVLGAHCDKDSTSLPKEQEVIIPNLKKPIKGMKIGVPWQFLKDLQPEYRKSFEESLQVYKNQGAEIVEVDLSILKYSIAVYYILATAEASTNLARFDGIRYGQRSKKAQTLDEVYDLSRQEGFGDEVKRRIILGTFVLSSGYQEAYYKKAQKVRTLILQKFKEAFNLCSIIAMPTSPISAFEIGSITDPLQMYLADIYTIAANLAGIPAISIPSGFTADKKPIGLQLHGPQLADALVCQTAYAFQQATDFHKQLPELFRD
jgi:aspartyl-tRNA(Asn)/glutamyl-tRNA(Gln) amidotransferase subunit A